MDIDQIERLKPMEIEQRSFEIISQEAGDAIPDDERAMIIKRVIHTSADFDYIQNLCFSENAVQIAQKALKNGAWIVTDTKMALSGINKKSLQLAGGEAHCFISDEDIAQAAKEQGTTRASVCVDKAARLGRPLIYAVGNAPTALIRLYELIRAGDVPSGADHRCTGRLCQCRTVKGADHADGCALYRGKGTQGRQQRGGGDLQRAAVSTGREQKIIYEGISDTSRRDAGQSGKTICGDDG